MSLGRWGIAALASGAAHGALLAGLALAVAPAPPPAPAPAEAAFDLVSYPVPQSKAVPESPEAESAPEAAVDSQRAGSGAIPQSRAAPAPLTEDALTETAPPGTTLAAAPPGAETLADAPGSAESLAPLAAAPEATLPAAVAGDVVAERAPPAAPLAAERPASKALAAAAVAPGAALAALAPPAASPAAEQPEALALTPGRAGTPAPEVSGQAARLAVASAPAPVLAAAPSPAARIAGDLAEAQRLGADPVRTAPLRATAVPREAVGGVVPAALRVRTAPPPSAKLGGAAPEVAALARIDPPADTLLNAPPMAAVLPDDELTAPSLPRIAPPADPLPGAAPGAVDLAALAPPAERATAALAWSGGAGEAVDPVSLAAIQSFTAAGDPDPAEGPPVRDRIGALLASVPCARLQTEFDPDTGALTLRGHVPEDGLRGPVLQALAAQVGPSIPLRDAVLILPRPVCGALAGIAAVGLAQSDDQDGDPKVVGAAPHTAVRRFAEGERLSFALLGPDYPAFYYIDYFDASGSVIHLQPNDTVPLRAIAPKGRAEVGSGADGQPALELYAAPPFGQEILAAFAASAPLYEGTRPLVERADAYLAFLRDRVAAVRAAEPGFKGEWFYIFVQTGP